MVICPAKSGAYNRKGIIKNMKNDIYHISKKQINEYLIPPNDRNKVLHIDFKKITSWKEYSAVMERALVFPRPCEGSPNRFLDWIRDLSWQNYDRYDIFIYNFKKFSSKCFLDAYEVYREYKETILPFWEYEAERCIVGGKSKAFNVYFVE